MSEAMVREPCLHCSEPAALSARICPHCKQSLLVDVLLASPVRDPKTAYSLASSLSRVGGVSRSVPDLKRALAGPRPVLANGISRQDARQIATACEVFSLSPREELAKQKGIPRPTPLVMAGAGAAVLLAMVLFWVLSPSETASPPPEVAEVAEPAPEVPTTLTTAQVAEAAGPSTVSLTCGNQIGSGFFVSQDQLVTNAHVVCGDNSSVDVHFADGRELPGRVRHRNAKLDLALVDAPGANASPIPFGDASTLTPGSKVIIIGTPHGMEQTVHEGIVSHVGRHMMGVAYIQVDANVNPGNSGGPLLDETGKLVGIVTAKIEGASGIGFALPINYVYDGPKPLVGYGPTSSTAWTTLLAGAEENEQEERARLAKTFRKPALVAATWQNGGIIVVVLERFPEKPRRKRSVPVSIESFGREVCRTTVDMQEWLALEDYLERSRQSLPDEMRRMQELDLAEDLWYGAGFIGGGDACSGHLRGRGQGLTIAIRDAEDGYERARVTR